MSRNFAKPSLSIENQIEHLQKHGMKFADHDKAINWLTHSSYYRLSAYWLFFENPKDHAGPRFKDGTTFERVTALYDFDRELRRLTFKGTEHLEVALRGNWAYQLGQLADGHSYLDAALYKDRAEFHRNFAKLASGVGRSSETYIKHYRENYDVPALPPVWMVAEMMSFGELSRWFSNLKDRSLRNKVASPLGLSETVLVPLVRHINDIRNTCAHHGRLWNRGFRMPPKLAEKPQALNQSLDLTATQAGLRLYNGLTMLAHVIWHISPATSWHSELKQLLTNHPENALHEMGFPSDWRNRPIWSA